MDTLGLPAVFGRYLLLRRLSRGGMGEIFLAKVGEIQGMEKLCIIKKVLPQLAEDQGFIRRFVDEAQIAIKLQHANIAPVYEVGMVGGEYFLAMEYVDGRDLRRTLSRAHELTTRMKADVALYIVREIANGLAYAHRRTDENGKEMHIVHCDVSPPNVLLSFEGEVKLIDFGIAKSRQQLSITDPNVGFGKFGYMAPEQLVRGRKVDRRTDIYAAGVILYELLVGDRMIVQNEGSDYRSLARMIASGKIDPPSKRDPTVPPEIDELVMKAIAAEPGERFQTAEELREAVQRRLYALNPTISADVLAKLLRDFFGAEANEDHALLAQARALDLAPFREEIDGARTHTVSFALAAPFEDVRTAPRERGQSSGRTEIVKLTRTLTWPRVALASAGLVLLAGVGVAAIRASSAPHPQPPPVAAAAPPGEKVEPKVEAVEPPAEPPKPPPMPPMIVQRPRPTSKPQGTRTKQTAARPAHAVASSSVHTATQAQVEAKFRAVRREYDDFKRAFGPRLEPSWNRLLEQYTFSQGEGKFTKFDGMLDEFRREMAKVKNGG
jgi:eukaryotic-like serine/threonine-protein kinase